MLMTHQSIEQSMIDNFWQLPFYSLNEDHLQIRIWADNWKVIFGAAKSLIVSRLKDAEARHSSLTFLNTILPEVERHFGHFYSETIVLGTYSRQDGQGSRKVASSPQKSFTILEPKPVGYDL